MIGRRPCCRWTGQSFNRTTSSLPLWLLLSSPPPRPSLHPPYLASCSLIECRMKHFQCLCLCAGQRDTWKSSGTRVQPTPEEDRLHRVKGGEVCVCVCVFLFFFWGGHWRLYIFHPARDCKLVFAIIPGFHTSTEVIRSDSESLSRRRRPRPLL